MQLLQPAFNHGFAGDIPARWPMSVVRPPERSRRTIVVRRMKFWTRITARRQKKAHERYLRERARQKALQDDDVQQRIRDVAQGSGASQQGMYGQ
jgi:hypothetical protein